MDCVIEMMKKCGILPTVKNYIELAYMGDKSSLEELEGEERVYVDDLIEDGLLVDTESEYAN
jgi:hypothetical protein